MSFTQIDKDFFTIREKVITENETFLKKFQSNVDYSTYKKKNAKPVIIPIVLVVLFCALVGAGVYFLYKYFPDYFVYEFTIGIALVLGSIAFIIAKFTKKLKQESAVNKNGYYNAVLTIENSYDKLLSFMQSINLETATEENKFNFYANLGKVFGNISSKLSKVYSNKTDKLKKVKSDGLDWQWLIKYLYNFGKFCYNKKKDCKSFTSLLSM